MPTTTGRPLSAISRPWYSSRWRRYAEPRRRAEAVDDLDRIPWKDLTHAYGSADDVPDLLRALRTASPDLQGEESPLWQLFGNIWHQGTIYEATAYAVPFLIEIAANARTPDRPGVLALLGEIAKGSSYRDVHGDLLDEVDFEEKRGRELGWVEDAHAAVARGFAVLVGITRERSDVRFAAAHVLAQLRERGVEVGSILRGLLETEVRSAFRAGLLLLLGQTGDQSEQTRSVLSTAVNDDDIAQRRAAALAIARLRVRPLPQGAREAIIETFTADAPEASFDGLPWDACGEINRDQLLACLDPSDRDQIADHLIAALESREASENQVATLINVLFPLYKRGPAPNLTAKDLSRRQLRAVRAMLAAMEGGKRIFYGHFPCWGLPDTMREWRDLAAGREPNPVDETLPLLAELHHPRKPVRPDRLKVGKRVVHRYFGIGTVTRIEADGAFTRLMILFDEEGCKTLSLPSDGSPLS